MNKFENFPNEEELKNTISGKDSSKDNKSLIEGLMKRKRVDFSEEDLDKLKEVDKELAQEIEKNILEENN